MKIKHFLSVLLISVLFVFLYNAVASDKKARSFPLPEFNLPIVGDQSKSVTLGDIKGEMFIMNFFATWCRVCLQEHGDLVAISKEIAMPIYGVAIRDDDQNLDKLLNNFGNPYKITLSDLHGYSSRIPVRGLPTTILVNANGDIIAAHAGAMTKDVFDYKFLPHLQ